MMAKSNDAWGIEVGASAIKAVRLVFDGDVVSVADYDVMPFKIPLVTPDVDTDEQIRAGLDQFLSHHETKKSTVMVSVPGHAAFARFAKLPPVDPKKINEIVRFEAAQQVPFPIDQVEWDYQVFQSEDSPDVEVGIFAITKERVTQFLSHYRAVNMTIDGLTMSPLAVFNGLCYDLDLDPKKDSAVFVDIGTTSTDVVICDHGAVWIRTLQIGGNDFTEALIRAFKVSFSKAEKLKREARTSKYARQIFQAMRPVFADLVQELQRSLGFYQSMNRDSQLTRLIGVGSTFRLPGLQKFLKQQLSMEVVRPSKFEKVEIDGKHEADFAEHAVNMATAYGLAIQGLGLEWLTANLLPKEIVRQRVWKSKQPWFAAASLLMAASVGGAYAYQTYLSQAYEPQIEKTDAVVEPVLKKAQKYVAEWRKVSKLDSKDKEIKILIGLFEYRNIWPKLLKDINDALAVADPQPALLTNNYDEIAKIPLRERRRLYLTDMSMQYVEDRTVGRQDPNEDEEDTAATDTGKSKGEKSKAARSKRKKKKKKPDDEKEHVPAMRITLKGWTSLDRATAIDVITEKFLGHLREVAKRPGWPYEITFGKLPLKRIKDADSEGHQSEASRRQGQGPLRLQAMTPGVQPGMAPGMAPGMVPGMMPRRGRADSPDEILPKRPFLMTPETMKDQRFEIVFDVTVIPVDKREKVEPEKTPGKPLEAASASPHEPSSKPEDHAHTADRKRKETL